MDPNLFRDFQETLIKLRRDTSTLVKMNVIHTPKLYLNESDYIVYDIDKKCWCVYSDDNLITDKWNPTGTELLKFIDKYDNGDVLVNIELYNSDMHDVYMVKNAILFFDTFNKILNKCKENCLILEISSYKFWYENGYHMGDDEGNIILLTDDVLRQFLINTPYVDVHNGLDNINKQLM